MSWTKRRTISLMQKQDQCSFLCPCLVFVVCICLWLVVWNLNQGELIRGQRKGQWYLSFSCICICLWLVDWNLNQGKRDMRTKERPMVFVIFLYLYLSLVDYLEPVSRRADIRTKARPMVFVLVLNL